MASPKRLNRVQRMTVAAFDLSEKGATAGLASHRKRVQLWRSRVFMISQLAITGGLAWWLGQNLLGHPIPFFATVTAMVSLGFSFGQRTLRVIEIATGVAIGVAIGDLFVWLFGTGAWQVTLAVFLSMSIATWLRARDFLIMQSGIQAAVVITLLPDPAEGFSRWTDAVLGGALALIVATIAPAAPVHRPRIKAAAVLEEVASTLRAIQRAAVDADPAVADEVLERARKSESSLEELSKAVDEGMAVVRYSPFQRNQRQFVQRLADLVTPLDHLLRNLRIVARRVAVARYRGDSVPSSVLSLMQYVANDVEFCAWELANRRIPVRARSRIMDSLRSSSTPAKDLNTVGVSGIVVWAALRSMLADLLELSGLDQASAREKSTDVD